MGYIFVDRESEGGSQSQMRSQMRRNMRSGYYRHDGDMYMRGNYKENYNEGYETGYRHGWQDSMNDEEEYRRGRDSYGRYR